MIDVQGGGWKLGSETGTLSLDGRGHLFDSTTNASYTAVALTPIGPHGSLTLTATMQIPADSPHWIGMGFANAIQPLNGSESQSGPWLRIDGAGGMLFYGGSGTNHPLSIPNTATNDGTPLTISFRYDAFSGSASVTAVHSGFTNVLVDSMHVTSTLAKISARYLVLQFSSNVVPLTNRWVGEVAVDWFPRPAPLLTLPVAADSIVVKSVGSPSGTNDTLAIQNALNFASASDKPVEIRFDAGAEYTIANEATNAFIPLTLVRATNVWINGNGCRILITNPRSGFLHLQSCSNIIIQAISVDYDPLPYTQGVVTRNLYTDSPTPGTKETAIEFQLDQGYPAPTNGNYIDSNAVQSAERWGTIMNTNFPGRGADNRHTIYLYTDVHETSVSGVYKVRIPNSNSIQTIRPNDFWCMVSRWNGSSVYSAGSCYQITFLDLTNYAGPAAIFEAMLTPMANEINCRVEIGPPPIRATRSRIKSSNADGGLFGSSRIGSWVEGCSFTGMSDDVANANTEPFVVTNAPASATNTFSLWLYNIIKAGGPPSPPTSYYLRVGDQLAFSDALTGVIFDQAIIRNVDLPSVTVDHPVSGIVNGTYQTNTLVYNNTLNTSAVYLNNQFSNSRIHGIYCRANNMLIAHNAIRGMGLSAISAFPALRLASPNSFVPTNVVIMGNVLSDCSYSYESIHNAIPDGEPGFALIEFHQTRYNSDYVSNTFGISGVRILNNAFLNWRRAPLSLHNVSDFQIRGNYFGPPITGDDLSSLADDVIADLWSCDYASMVFSENVNATKIPDGQTIFQDNEFVPNTNIFQTLEAPQLALISHQTNQVVYWLSQTPAFVLQQTDAVEDGSRVWIDSTNLPFIGGKSNSVTLPSEPDKGHLFYRARQR